jgi:beta-galactosidase/beta-glucuronidase
MEFRYKEVGKDKTVVMTPQLHDWRYDYVRKRRKVREMEANGKKVVVVGVSRHGFDSVRSRHTYTLPHVVSRFLRMNPIVIRITWADIPGIDPDPATS